MPFPVKHLIEGQSNLVCVKKDDLASYGFKAMIEHDFSQLPVVDADDRPLGMVTHEAILRGIKNFNTRLESLHIRDVMIDAPIFNLEDDLFDLLDRLKFTNAVLIVDPSYELAGIVTTYDATEYFRKRTENLMIVEDIETILKDFIREAYTTKDNEIDAKDLEDAITRISSTTDKKVSFAKSFDKLTLSEYINLLTFSRTWDVLQPVLAISKESLRGLLDGIRNTRNDLAHFRNEITAEQQDQLQFCADWLSKRQTDWEEKKQQELLTELFKKNQIQSSIQTNSKPQIQISDTTLESSQPDAHNLDTISLQEYGPIDSRYAPLADYLLSQPGKNDLIHKTFDEVEAIIGGALPASARRHRAWWANDAIGHPHAKSWLESGWRSSSINLNEGRVTFNRIKEREKAYIDFFSSILADLSKKAEFLRRNISPDGASWIYIAGAPSTGTTLANFAYSFTRDKRFRVELYIDTYKQENPKQLYDQLAQNKEFIESQLGPLSWERIDHKRASRIALYHNGQITDNPKELRALKEWAVETMIKFYKALAPEVDKAANPLNDL